jgi:formamidopyrimidine-DNA glycosylase
VACTRRGKYLLLHLDRGILSFHLRMTGRLYLVEQDGEGDPWTRARFALGGRDLIFSDARKFGRISWLADLSSLEARLGPEPFDALLTPELFASRIRANTPIKVRLLDQSVLAGIGNIYADEGLHRAGIHPVRRAGDLSLEEMAKLLAALRATLLQAIDLQGATIGWYRQANGQKGHSQEQFKVYGRTGQPCLRCGISVERLLLAGRATHFCPRCQH